ncbi:Glycosyltransferase involved in cell wall bisynthesis [Halopenitus malekzadehii]|uniref:Glycosyltransferase involved in cell wall bisynthesis n=1 Tax=Halopenitus malekzadehii TaxID=1267564 RepID=A0A1H6IAR9_9EURY|nr:glycosyltransferase [Halopenitus malekzadehii]SEH46349.1 Glycosyltransferase involved in cell wall bisynthesis [Halopenitus malekzadehii]
MRDDVDMNDILFLTTGTSVFTTKDREMLEERYNVTTVEMNIRKEPTDFITLVQEIRRHDLLFGWFASPTVSIATLIASFLNTSSIIITGGFDVARVPEIEYGLTLDSKYYHLTRAALTAANKVLAVSESNKTEALEIAPTAHIETVYVGAVDTETFVPGTDSDENLVLTVGAVKTQNLVKKGLKPFAEASKLLPDKEFVILGDHADEEAVSKLRASGGDNLSLPGYASFDDLVKYYQRAGIYVQASRHESFGISLAEAMACECVPVASRHGSLPEVVGETGVYVDPVTPKGLKTGIIDATELPGTPARQRVLEKFRKAQRRDALYSHVDDVLERSRTYRG